MFDAGCGREAGRGAGRGAGSGEDDAGAGRAVGVGLEQALAAVDAAVSLLAAVDVDGEADVALADGVVQAQRLRERLAAQQLRVLARVDAREVHRADGAVSCAAWLRGRTRLDPGPASRLVGAARRLGGLPLLADRLERGAVGLDHVVAVSEAMVPGRAAAVAEAEPILVELACAAAPAQVRRALRCLADIVDADGTTTPPLDETGPDPRRELLLSRGLDGLWRLTGELDPLCGEALAVLLDAYDSPGTPDAPDAPEVPEASARDRRSPAQRRHDALEAAVRRLLDAGEAPQRQGVKPHIVAVVDLATLAGADDDAGRAPRLAFAGEVTPGCVRRLARQAKLTVVATAGPWRPVGVGRTQRSLPAWLRPALAAQHAHCRGPDCDRPFTWTQAHHLTAWADGGGTDLAGMIPLCQAHHSMVTAGTWQVTMNPDTGACTWTGPAGRSRITHPPPQH